VQTDCSSGEPTGGQFRNERVTVFGRRHRCIGKREIPGAGADLGAGRGDLYFNFVETAVPFDSGRIVAEGVGHAGVFHGVTNGAREVIGAVKGSAAGALRENAHGIECFRHAASGQARLRFRGVSNVRVEVPLVCADGRSEQASRIYGINGNVGVRKRACGSADIGGEIFSGVVRPIEVKFVETEANGKAGGNPYQVLAAFPSAKMIGDGDESGNRGANAIAGGLIGNALIECEPKGLALGSFARGSGRIGRVQAGVGELGIVELAAGFALVTGQDLAKDRGVGSEVVQNVQAVAEPIESDIFLRLNFLEHSDDVFACERLVGCFGVERVEKNNGNAGGDVGLFLRAVGVGVGRKGSSGWGGREICFSGENADFLGLAIVEDGEILLCQAADGVAVLVVDDDVDLDETGRGAQHVS